MPQFRYGGAVIEPQFLGFFLKILDFLVIGVKYPIQWRIYSLIQPEKVVWGYVVIARSSCIKSVCGVAAALREAAGGAGEAAGAGGAGGAGRAVPAAGRARRRRRRRARAARAGAARHRPRHGEDRVAGPRLMPPRALMR